MSPAAFIDANIPIYAAGRPHPLKKPSIEVLRLIPEHPQAFMTDAEVLQELIHRYISLRMWPSGKEVFRQFAVLMTSRVESVQAADVEFAATMVDDHPQLASRDLVHVAVMERLGLRRIISGDKGFDRLPGIERLDPGRFDDWQASLLSGS